MASCRSDVDISAISRVLSDVVNEQRRQRSSATQSTMSVVPKSEPRSTIVHVARSSGLGWPTGASAVARALRDTRVKAAEAFPAGMISDPVFDMLLEAFIAEEEGQRRSISQLAQAAGVPGTTTLRWLSRMEAEGLVQREADPFDARRVFIRLSESARTKMGEVIAQSPLKPV